MFLVFNLKKFRKIFKFVFALIFIFVLLNLIISYINYIFPVKYENLIEKYSLEYGLDKNLVFAVVNVESRFDENAVSKKGATGLMQLMPETADWIAKKAIFEDYREEDLKIPSENIKLGCWYLSYFIEKYNNLDLALASYNAGRGNVLKWLKDERYSQDGKTLDTIPFKETDNYIKKVTFIKKGYEIIFKFRKILNI